MKIDPKILALKEEATRWRRDFHENPELLYEVHRTAGIVAAKLKEFGCDEVVEGIGKTGVIGVIHGRKSSSKVVGLRADMDALPIEEETNLPHRSKTSGTMHACGHDGHTAMLLGAAKHLAATRDFDGTVIVIFQPAEEGGAGGKAMVEDGMMDRWGIQEVYGMHNMPGIAPGHISLKRGPIMAAADQFTIEIEGKGAHAAAPHLGIDPVLIGAHIITALQSIASRNADPLKSVVVSTTMFHAGTAFNIIPSRATLTGTVRTLEHAMRDLAETRFRAIVEGTAKMFGAEVTITYNRGYPATVNHDREADYVAEIAKATFGTAAVDDAVAPMMGGEDFSYMLLERPGAYIFIGNGDTAGLHHPAYDFNDDALPAGIQIWTEIAKARTAA